MDKEKISEALKAIIDGLQRAEDEEIRRDKYDAIQALISSNADFLKNPEHFDLFINHKLDRILELCVKEVNPISNENSFYKLYFIYRHYSYLDNSLEKYIKLREGIFACADKSRWLLNSYVKYITEGSLPDMTIDDKCYWKPKFGSREQWMNLCDGLMEFYYGNPMKYMTSIKELTMEK